MELEITGTEGERQNTKGRIQDDIDHQGATQNYRITILISPSWGSAEIQGYS
jgi:hypothetical protein